MAGDPAELFNILQDPSTDAGAAPTKREDGDTVVDTVAIPVLPCKDSLDKHRYIPINLDGTIPVSSALPGIPKRNIGTTVLGVNGVPTKAVTLVLTASKTHNCINWKVSATRTFLWELVQDNDGSETVLDEAITGAGDYNYETLVDNGKLEITSGSTGTQEIFVRGTAQDGSGATMHARVSLNEKL